MKKEVETKSKKRLLWSGAAALVLFGLWTAAVCFLDVQPIGPGSAKVGLATVNLRFFRFTGVHLALYALSDWLSLVPMGFILGFAGLGLAQLIVRKSLLKVDFNLLALGVFYVVVLAAYLLFEQYPVNVRPVLINGCCEASYPSSTTLLVLSVVPTAMLQLKGRILNKRLQKAVLTALAVFVGVMVLFRLIAGVHWLTDIVGGVILSAGLVLLYAGVVQGKGVLLK